MNAEKRCFVVMVPVWKEVQIRQIDDVLTGALMKSGRESMGLSLCEVARRMKFSAPYISDIEKGRRKWNQKLADDYAKAVES